MLYLNDVEKRIRDYCTALIPKDYSDSGFIQYVYPRAKFYINLTDSEKDHSDSANLFRKLYNIKMPEEMVDMNKTKENLFNYYKENQKDILHITHPFHCMFFKQGMIRFCGFGAIVFYTEEPELPEEIYKCIATKESEREFGYVVKDKNGFTTQPMKIKDVNVDLSLQYNDGFPYAEITNFIISDSGGLIIFHGTPGCGKTTYIRHLISSNPNKDFYFLDSSIFAYIMDPSFITFLIEHKNSVFILEDCEDILANRNTNRNNLISGLLNITDGIVGDSLNIKFICTFNSDLSSIDPALLRKGRLKIKYEFDKLDKSKAQKLINSLGKEYTVTEPMALCDIYNFEEDNGVKQKKKIGF